MTQHDVVHVQTWAKMDRVIVEAQPGGRAGTDAANHDVNRPGAAVVQNQEAIGNQDKHSKGAKTGEFGKIGALV